MVNHLALRRDAERPILGAADRPLVANGVVYFSSTNIQKETVSPKGRFFSPVTISYRKRNDLVQLDAVWTIRNKLQL
jgi:hypothetical protein